MTFLMPYGYKNTERVSKYFYRNIELKKHLLRQKKVRTLHLFGLFLLSDFLRKITIP